MIIVEVTDKEGNVLESQIDIVEYFNMKNKYLNTMHAEGICAEDLCIATPFAALTEYQWVEALSKLFGVNIMIV